MQSPDASEAKPDNSPWIYAMIGVVVAALVAGALLLFLGDDEKAGRQARGPSRGKGIKQADWKIQVRFVRGPGLPNKKGDVSKREARPLDLMIRRIYEAVYLRPQLLPEVTKRYMTGEAASAMRRASPLLPDKADRIKTLRRVALVGIDSATAGRAAAEVRIVATGKKGDKKFKAVTRDRLWLERVKGKWRVLAYNVNLEPAPLKPGKGKKGGGPKGAGKKKGGDSKGAGKKKGGDSKPSDQGGKEKKPRRKGSKK
jgi:hypothetical protein